MECVYHGVGLISPSSRSLTILVGLNGSSLTSRLRCGSIALSLWAGYILYLITLAYLRGADSCYLFSGSHRQNSDSCFFAKPSRGSSATPERSVLWVRGPFSNPHGKELTRLGKGMTKYIKMKAPEKYHAKLIPQFRAAISPHVLYGLNHVIYMQHRDASASLWTLDT